MASNYGLSGVTGHTSPEWWAREAEIARIAGTQQNQITLEQLLSAGLSQSAVSDRCRTGRLHRSHRGVYSIGRPPASPNEHRMAAVLACGPRAVLSHASAAAHLGIRPSAASAIDVTSPTGTGRALPGLRVHRSTSLAGRDVALIERIPTTSCARTLLDLAETLNPDALAKAIDQAEILRIFDLTELENVLARNRGRHALAPLQALLSSLDPHSNTTRSDFERDLLRLVADAGLPSPEVNTGLLLEGRWVEADFLWHRERLVAETDGWETHRTRQAFERDRGRDQLLLRAGYRTVRFTWRQLEDAPITVIRTIRTGLSLAAA